jgi:ABC-2 type transport system permease protein
MLGALLCSELRIHLRQRSLWLGLPAVAALGVILTNGIQVEQDLAITSTYHLLNLHVVLLMMTLPFIVGVLGMTALLRDSQHRFCEVSYSTPLAPRRFLLIRFAGLVAMTLLVLVTAQASIATGIALRSAQPVALVALASNLVWIAVVVVLPAALAYCALYLVLSTCTRNAIALHFAMLVAFMAYMMLAMRSGSPVLVNPGLPSPWLVQLMAVLDPFAMAPVSAQAEHLTIAERNASGIALDGALLLNRVAVIALAAAALGVALQRFHLRLPETGRRRRRALAGAMGPVSSPAYAPCPVRSGPAAQWRAFVSLCRVEYATTLKSNLFLLILVTWTLIIGGEVLSGLTWLEPMATRVPGTADALNRFQWNIVPQLGMLILLLVSSELSWRDRDLDISAIVAPTPVSNLALLGSKWLSLVMIIITLLGVSVVLAVASQLLHSSPIDVRLYAMFFVHTVLPLVCVGTLCLAVNALSPGRITGIAITVAVLALALTPLGSKLGLEHPLLQFAQTPLQPWSDLTGFAGTTIGFGGFMIFWLAVSALLMTVALGLFHRGLAGKRSLRRLARQPAWIVAAALTLVLAVVAGRHVEQQLRRSAYFLTSSERAAWKADYERTYGHFKDTPSPSVEHAAYDVAFYPVEQRLDVAGAYTLTNRNPAPLGEVLVSAHMDAGTRGLELESARLVEHDAAFGQYLFALEPAMQPGEHRVLRFETALEHTGYGAPRTHALIVPGFSYLRAIPYLPTVGYVEPYELRDNETRRLFGLAPRPEPPTLPEAIAACGGDFSAEYDWVTVDTKISTTANEVAIAQGELLEHREDNGRSIFHFRTIGPIRNIVAFVSGELDKRSRRVDGVELEIYFKRGHERNVEHMLDAMTAAVRYLQENVGPYPYPQLRLIETPVPGMKGYAMPQTVMIGEDVGFKADLDNPEGFDHVFRRAVHEVAHQWFGHGIGNGVPADGAFLVESLAKYVELVVLRRLQGREPVERLVGYELGRYHGGRARAVDAEEPLALADATHVVYSKASVVFFQLIQAVGEDSINRTLRELWHDHSYPKPPATSLDFVAALKRNTGPDHHQLIEDLLLRGDSQLLLSEDDLAATPDVD